MNQTAELLKAAKPLMDYLREHHTPMTTAIVTDVSVDVLESHLGAKLSGRENEE